MFTSCVLVSPSFTVCDAAVALFLPTTKVRYSRHSCCSGDITIIWLVVEPTSLKNDGVRQLGWWNFQYMEQILQMFQTTNQIIYWYSRIIPYTYIIHILYIYYTYILYIYYTYIIHIFYIYYTHIIHILYTYYTYIPYYTIIIWQCPKILLFLIIVLFPPALSIQKTFA